MKRIVMRALCTVVVLVGLGWSAWAYTFYYMSSIAYDPVTGVYGWSTGWLYTRDAVQGALRACQKQGGVRCKVAIPAFDSCGALSAGSKHRDWGIGLTKDLAISRAMNACRGDDGQTSCRVLVAFCSQMGSAPDFHPSSPGGAPFDDCNLPGRPGYKPYEGSPCE